MYLSLCSHLVFPSGYSRELSVYPVQDCSGLQYTVHTEETSLDKPYEWDETTDTETTSTSGGVGRRNKQFPS